MQQQQQQQQQQREQDRIRREDPLSYMSSSFLVSDVPLYRKEWGGSESDPESVVGDAAKRLLEGLSEKEKAALLATLLGKDEENSTEWGGRDYIIEENKDEFDDRNNNRRNQRRHQERQYIHRGPRSPESRSESRRRRRSRSQSHSRQSRDHHRRYRSRHHHRRERYHVRSRSRSLSRKR
jgi:hypothetical protein